MLFKTLLASAAFAVSLGAGAQVTGSIGGGGPDATFAHLSAPGAVGAGGSITGVVSATIVGGTIFSADLPFADIPAGTVVDNRFLSAGPPVHNDQPSTITFAGTGLDYISFLWGSPDLYNLLTVNTTSGTMMFTAASLGFPVTDGTQSFSTYVQFVADAGQKITSLVLTTSPAQDAFEVANFNLRPVPEPETYALMLAGLAAMGFVARRRRNV